MKDIRLLVTNNCNYNCYFCHAEGVKKLLEKHELSVDNYVTIFNLYRDIENWNGITISGGEPFIYRNIDLLIEKLYENGAKITVVTNGSLLHLHLSSMKYIDRINVSIHTMNNKVYSNITGKDLEELDIVKDNLKMVRENYPNLNIRLNVTPCKNSNWRNAEMQDLIDYSKEINATIKLVELFPNNQENCIKIETLRKQIEGMQYKFIPFENRGECFENNGHQIFLTQCNCSKAIVNDSPIEYCREHLDFYVNHDATFPLCRLSNDYIDFWKEIEENNIEGLKNKIKQAQIKLSSSLCMKHLESIKEK